MSRSILKSVMASIVFAGACGSSSKDDIEQKGPPQNFLQSELCRYVADSSIKPMDILNITSQNGGRSCFTDEEKIVIIPSKDGKCQDFGRKLVVHESISIDDGDHLFTTCSPMFKASTEGSSAVYYTVADKNFHDEDRGFFLLGADIQTLVTNDALPVSHFGRYGRLLCMETKDSSKILDHIRHAEVFIPENVSLTVTEGASCARISRDIQGLEWPEFRPDIRPS